MNKVGDLLSGVPLAGIAFSAFLTGSIYGSQFRGIDWETLTAGFMGLIGGLLAYRAATAHQRAIALSNSLAFRVANRTELKRIFSQFQQIDQLTDVTKSVDKCKDFSEACISLETILSAAKPFEPALANIITKCIKELTATMTIWEQNVTHGWSDKGLPIISTTHPDLVLIFTKSLTGRVNELVNYCEGENVFL